MADTILSYSFQPTSVFITTTINMKLVVTNPINGSVVDFKGGPNGDEIDILFPAGAGDTDLVSNLNFTCQSPSGFSCGKASLNNYFSIKANVSTKLQKGQSLEFLFLNVPINSGFVGPSSKATIKITEFIGQSEGENGVVITKMANNKLSIFAWADPSIIALNDITTLYWQSAGGTKVTVEPFKTGEKTFDIKGDPPFPGTTAINIPYPTVPQYKYTLKVWAAQVFDYTEVTITQNPPLITAFNADKSGDILADADVVLDWFYLWGTNSSINSNSGFQKNNPLSPITVNPGKELVKNYVNNYGNMPSTIDYKLAVDGFDKPTSDKKTVNILPIKLVYFKFTKNDNGNLSGMNWLFYPKNWGAYKIETIGNNLNILTLYQPGSKTEVYYLGAGDTTHPQIQYFNFTSKGSGVWELNWVTANLSALVLQPVGYTVPAGDIDSGKKEVNAAGDYTLTGTGKNGEIITSTLTVTA